LFSTPHEDTFYPTKEAFIMSWTDIGPHVVVEPLQSVTWHYVWPQGQDMGLQLAGPNVFAAPGSLGTLVATDQGKEIDGINNVSYVVTIRNLSSTDRGIHNLQGGGVS
jgi:hypothetical protein